MEVTTLSLGRVEIEVPVRQPGGEMSVRLGDIWVWSPDISP